VDRYLRHRNEGVERLVFSSERRIADTGVGALDGNEIRFAAEACLIEQLRCARASGGNEIRIPEESHPILIDPGSNGRGVAIAGLCPSICIRTTNNIISRSVEGAIPL
jgi:hypothetical protein